MNDLNGLDWTSKPAAGQKAGQGNYSSFSALKPTPPASGRASPLAGNVQQSVPSKTSTPANDSFANLVGFSSSNKNLTLQEQQRLREQSKVQQLVNSKAQLQSQWAANDDAWNSLGSGRSTPAIIPASNGDNHAKSSAEDDDLFAAFNKPSATASTKPVKATPVASPDPEDDDPFGLSELKTRQTEPSEMTETLMGDDDDVLGDLGRPVQAKTPPTKQQSPQRRPSPEPVALSDHSQNQAVAELVDMGFPAEKAKRALEATDTGTNVQAAVGLLLNQAHEEARQKTRGREAGQPLDRYDEQAETRNRQRQSQPESARDRSSTPSNDPGKAAQDLAAGFMKSAGAFWKTAQKQVSQAVKEFNSDTESGTSTPKWMHETAAPSRSRPEERRQRPEKAVQQPSNVTDEAMMLESERPTPPPQQRPARSRPDVVLDARPDTSRDHSPAMPSRLRESHSPQPAFMHERQQDPLASMMRPKPQQAPRSAREMLSKQSAEEQASQAYTSSARRRKPATPTPAQEADLLEGSSSRPAQALPSRPATKSAPPQPQRVPKAVTPVQTRPPPPTRNVPPISAIALRATNTARAEGNGHYKRGDYSAAHESYSTSLRHIPTSHPLQIVLLTNRALTALKTGQPKVSNSDADQAITLIGISKGESETIDVTDDDGKISAKPMRDYYGKALMRKAEALENLEKWTEAATVWRVCVQDGHGGATAIQGRARAEKAAAPKPPAAPAVKRPPQRSSARPTSTKPAAAVSALRAQNQAAEKLDDEKFALADSVAARVSNWRDGKENNLRALLASLDTVLWEGSGWKKIGMADLILPNKVKIHYMKGIGKCHPDKVSVMIG